jgi:hypothetical protein
MVFLLHGLDAQVLRGMDDVQGVRRGVIRDIV